MLPAVMRWLGPDASAKQEHADEIKAELRARQAALDEVDEAAGEADPPSTQLPEDVADHLRTRNEAACKCCRKI